MTYKGMMCCDVPYIAVALGYTNASWTLKCDLTSEYVCRLLNFMDQNGYARCTPRRNDPTVQEMPLLDFSSGYVQRSIGQWPRQGSVAPWRLYQNYVRSIEWRCDMGVSTMGRWTSNERRNVCCESARVVKATACGLGERQPHPTCVSTFLTPVGYDGYRPLSLEKERGNPSGALGWGEVDGLPQHLHGHWLRRRPAISESPCVAESPALHVARRCERARERVAARKGRRGRQRRHGGRIHSRACVVVFQARRCCSTPKQWTD